MKSANFCAIQGSVSRSSRDIMKAQVRAGRESRMKEPYKKGVAHHLHPESCADVGVPAMKAKRRGGSGCGNGRTLPGTGSR
jgi:hypothetical protein